MRRGTWIVLAVVVLGLLPAPLAAAELQPHIVNWEQIFKVEWETARSRNREVVRGFLTNHSPYHVRNVLLLVEGLDASGAVKGSGVSPVPGEFGPSARFYFEVPAPATSSQYRVRVYSFERIEAGSEIR